MSTTVCVAPTRCTSSSASRSRVVARVRGRVLEQQRLAEDRRGLGERHRQPALQRRALGERDVVECVAELVRERRDGVLAAVEVHHDAADVAAHARAVRAALLARHASRRRPIARRTRGSRAPTRSGENPANASRTLLGRARSTRRVPARPTGANRSHHGQATRRGRAAAPSRAGNAGRSGATRRPRRSSRRASHGRRCCARNAGSRSSANPRRRFSTPSSPFAPLSAAASGTATVAHASSSPSYAARRRAASGCVASPRANAIGTCSVLAVDVAASTVSCDEISPCSRCHASEPDGASSPASDSSCSLIWSSALSAALRSANACSAAAGLRAISASTSSDASHAPSRLPSGGERRGARLQLDVTRRGDVVAAVGADRARRDTSRSGAAPPAARWSRRAPTRARSRRRRRPARGRVPRMSSSS